METFKVTESYGNHCNECGKNQPGKVSNVIEINGVIYTLCEECLKQLIGALYLAKPNIFDEFITVLGKKDRSHMLSLINKP